MGETNNIYPTLKLNLSNDPQFRSNKINEIRAYFVAEIRKKEN